VPAGQAKGADGRSVNGFLQLAAVKDPGFAEKFRSEVTSGDPYQVQQGLRRLDSMSRDVAKDVAEKRTSVSPSSSAGWFFTNDTVAVDAVAVQHWSFATTGSVAAEAAAVVVIVLSVSPENQNLTTDKAVAALSTGLAG
jgi:SdpC family antimicrobial peptide